MISNRLLIVYMIGLNVLFVFLLVHKQNKMIHALYNMQHLDEIKQDLLEQKKAWLVTVQKGQQLSAVQQFAKEQLHMQALTLKDVTTIS